MIITITNINANDGYVNLRDEIIGKEFDAELTFTNVQIADWYTVVGKFVDEELNNKLFGNTDPIILSTVKYKL